MVLLPALLLCAGSVQEPWTRPPPVEEVRFVGEEDVDLAGSGSRLAPVGTSPASATLTGPDPLARQDDVAPSVALTEAVDDAVLDADLILHGVPVRTKRLLQPGLSRGSWLPDRIEVVHLLVEEVLVGDPGLESIALVQPGGGPPWEAREAIYFLGEGRDIREEVGDSTRRAIARAAAGAPVYERPRSGADRWPVSSGFTVDLRPHLGDEVEPATLSLPRALELVRASTRRALPRVRAFLVTTGPAPWRVLVGSDRYVHESPGGPDPPPRLSEEVWRDWIETLDSPLFRALDDEIGRSLAPCDGFVGIELHAVTGRHRTECYAPESVPPEQASQLAVFLRLWRELPAGDPPSWEE